MGLETDFVDKINNEFIDRKRGILEDMLFQCTQAQIDFFNRMYLSVDAIDPKHLDRAIKQTGRTLLDNEKKKGETNDQS